MDSDLTLLSTFTGLGGLDLGFEAAGFKCIGYIEGDAVARASLSANRPDWRKLSPHEIAAACKVLTPRTLGLRRRQLAVLAGGPPCQPFSKAAQWSQRAMRGLRDPRAKCMSAMLRLLRVFLPRVLLIENVEGFVRGRTSALDNVRRSLERTNRRHRTKYELQHWVVDAADYGVPQHRSRAILFAERTGSRLTLPSATHSADPVTAWDALHDVSADSESLPEVRHWGRLLPSIPEGSNYLWHTDRGGGLQLFGYRTRFWSFLLKLAKDRPAWTLPAQPGPHTGPFHWDNRVLAVPELLRLQTFPPDWVVKGSRHERVRQIGNATPPLLAEIIARAIREQVFGGTRCQALKLSIPRATVPHAKPRRLLKVPDEFRRMHRRRPAHPGTGRGPRPLTTKA
jgi:DNA (cytosine-5)-methyltransferase 1